MIDIVLFYILYIFLLIYEFYYEFEIITYLLGILGKIVSHTLSSFNKR